MNENSTNMTYLPNRSKNSSLSEIQISEKIFFNKLLKLDLSKSMGHDKFHPYFLKEVAREICLSLHIIFTKSLNSGVLPKDWKLVNVIVKKGSWCKEISVDQFNLYFVWSIGINYNMLSWLAFKLITY